jgi:hypothetical protein
VSAPVKLCACPLTPTSCTPKKLYQDARKLLLQVEVEIGQDDQLKQQLAQLNQFLLGDVELVEAEEPAHERQYQA